MEFLLFISLVSCVYGLKFGGPDYDAPFVPDPVTTTLPGEKAEDITVTVYTTHDSYQTVTDKFYNTVPITLTEFRKSTVTLPTRQVVRTPVDDVVQVRTQIITQRPLTETVTDIFSRHRCETEASIDLLTVTHLDQRILQTTITSITIKTLTFHPTIVRTVLSTEREISTETEFVTKTIWETRGQRSYSYL